MTAPAPPRIAAFADLMFGARIRAAADSIGAAMVLSTRPDRIVEAVAAGAGAVFVDLDTRVADPVALIATLKGGADTGAARVVAFARLLPELVRDPLAGAG